MRRRILLVIAVLSVVVAACGEGTGLSGDGVVLRYGFQPGESASYDIEMDLQMDMAGAGDIGVAGGLDMHADMHIFARTGYEIEEGPDPETIRLRTETSLVDGSGSMEMLGMTEEIPFGELAAGAPAMDVEMVIDSRGEILELLVGGQSVPPGLLENLGGGGTSPFGQVDPNQLVGPEFPDGPVAVGSTWETEIVEDGLGITVRSRSEHEVTGIEEISGRETHRIETVTTTDPIEFGFDDIISVFDENWEDLAAISGEDVSAAEMEASLSMLESMGIELNYRMDRSVTHTTTWFDAAEGLVVRVESSGPQHMSMEMRGIPDAGDIEFTIDMTLLMAMQLAG